MPRRRPNKSFPLPSPNIITLLGLFFSFGACISLSLEKRPQSLLLLGLMGLCDILDGAVAKRTKQNTPFGAFLDSTLDRLTEGFVFLGILALFYRHLEFGFVLLSYAALVGSYLVSYTRARGENLIKDCKVGFWERPERLVLLMLGVGLGHLKTTLWLLVLGSFLTALHRLCHLRATFRKRPLPQQGLWPLFFWPYKRYSRPWVLYATLAILLVFAF